MGRRRLAASTRLGYKNTLVLRGISERSPASLRRSRVSDWPALVGFHLDAAAHDNSDRHVPLTALDVANAELSGAP